MKTRRIISFVLSVMMLLSSVSIANAAAKRGTADNGGEYVSFDYSDICCGLVNRNDGAHELNVTFDGVNAVKITPTPDIAAGSFTLDHYNMHRQSEKVQLSKFKYVGITYYYDSDNPTFSGKMKLDIMPGATNKVVTGRVSKTSNQKVVAKQWAEAVFSFSDMQLNPDATTDVLQQLHFNPFYGVSAKNLMPTDVLYISKFTFYESHPDPNAEIEFVFAKGNPAAQGEEITIPVKLGQKYTLPENPYTLENGDFLGWKSEADGKTYAPGTEMTAGEVGVTYNAEWKIRKDYPDFISINFTEYQGGTVNGRKVAIIENIEKDGRNVVKITPNPLYQEEGVTTCSVDGYEYDKAGIDFSVYNWFVAEYYYESPNPKPDMRHNVRIYTGGKKMFAPGASAIDIYAEETIVSGAWATSTFDLTPVKAQLDPAKEEHIFDQMHFRSFGDFDFHGLTSNDVMYISRLVFYKEKPVQISHSAYMNGYEDGTFRPSGTMTRAEACTVIARLLEAEANIAGTASFADVGADAWYARYIGFCESCGLLAAYSGNFYPNQPITRAEFSELVYLTGLAKDKGIAASFTDVASAHPKYASVMAAAGAGLINGYLEADGTYTFRPDNTITRAEVVTVINRAQGRSRKQADLTSDIILVFLDVDDSHWAFADIAEAAIPHFEKDDKWLYPTKDPLVALQEKLTPEAFFDISGGKAKVAELDELEKARIEEIRNTPNMDVSGLAGNKVYVSSGTGDDNNDGLSPETAVKTIAKANSIVTKDGAVLLRRGDTFRGGFSAKANTTYTAYGEGAKPNVYGSPENGADPERWTLVYENKDTGALIWKYANESFTDVGTLVLNDGEGYAIKEYPGYDGKQFVLYGDSSKRFDYTAELDKNFEFFHEADSVIQNGTSINVGTATGPLYFRCDNGNPGNVFDSIEFNVRKTAVSCLGDNILIDNICIKYTGCMGISFDDNNHVFRNLEIGWIGGSIQSYSFRGSVGSPTRFGNGIEVYGRCDGYTVDNCYIYECYDAGVTHQGASSVTDGNDVKEDNVTYSNNVLVDNVYNIEYFLGHDNPRIKTSGTNILFDSNLCRRAGFGFGSSRPSIENQRHIRSGYSENQFYNFVIKNNIFDRAVHELTWTYSKYEACVPVLVGNTYIQGLGNRIFEHGPKKVVGKADVAGRYHIRNTLGDKTASIYFVDYIPPYTYTYTNDKVVPVTDEERKQIEKYAEEYGIPGSENVEPVVLESTEILEPLIVCTQKKGNLYKDARASFSTVAMTDNVSGIQYADVIINNSESSMTMDCHNLSPRIPVGDTGVVYFKLLLRTNRAGYKPHIRLHNVKDAAGNTLSGGSADSMSETVGNDEWETLIVKIEGVPTNCTIGQIHLDFAGRYYKGSANFDSSGSLKDNVYYNVAAWAAFSNLASAEAFDIEGAAK